MKVSRIVGLSTALACVLWLHKPPVMFGPVAIAAAQQSESATETPATASAWVVNCSSNAGGGLNCQMSQNLTERESGRRVLTVTVRKQEANTLAMLLALPHGLFLPAGATYQIDDGAKATIAIQTSDQNGAYAAVPVDEILLAALKRGSSLKVGMESVTRRTVTVPVSLAGFTAAVDKLFAVD